MHLRCVARTLSLEQPRVMGVINVTPDSFSDGGRTFDPSAAFDLGSRMVDEGAAIIDVGGESTRPGASPVDSTEELRRVIPVIERLAALDVVVSIDTSKAAVAREALAAGAHLVNDVAALSEPGMMDVVAGSAAAVCLMHRQGTPRTMQLKPTYTDVVGEVAAFLRERADACRAGGIDRDRIVLDPGFGFGKTLAHNVALLRNLPAIVQLGYPVLVGLSRKGMIGVLVGRENPERLEGSVAAAVVAVLRGARIVRAHDVAATVDGLAVAYAVMRAD